MPISTTSVYKTVTMMRALEQMKAPNIFLARTFFNYDNPTFSDDREVHIDIYKEKRRMANFQSHKIDGQIVDKTNFETHSYKPGYIKPKISLDADDVDHRPMEGVIYNSRVNPAAKQATIVGKQLKVLRDICTRKIEWMAARALQDGEITVSGEGIPTSIIDFNMLNTHKVELTSTNVWSDSDDCSPIDDLSDWKRLTLKDSGRQAKKCVMSFDSFTNFLASNQVRDYMDKLKINLGEIAPRDEMDGVTFIGRILGLDIYVYDEWYIDEDGNEQPMLDTERVILGSSDVYTSTHFAQIRNLKNRASTDFFPSTWEVDDPSVRYLMLESSPLVALSQADAFVSAKTEV